MPEGRQHAGARPRIEETHAGRDEQQQRHHVQRVEAKHALAQHDPVAQRHQREGAQQRRQHGQAHQLVAVERVPGRTVQQAQRERRGQAVLDMQPQHLAGLQRGGQAEGQRQRRGIPARGHLQLAAHQPTSVGQQQRHPRRQRGLHHQHRRLRHRGGQAQPHPAAALAVGQRGAHRRGSAAQGRHGGAGGRRGGDGDVLREPVGAEAGVGARGHDRQRAQQEQDAGQQAGDDGQQEGGHGRADEAGEGAGRIATATRRAPRDDRALRDSYTLRGHTAAHLLPPTP